MTPATGKMAANGKTPATEKTPATDKTPEKEKGTVNSKDEKGGGKGKSSVTDPGSCVFLPLDPGGKNPDPG
jgi:hypothetical protein